MNQYLILPTNQDIQHHGVLGMSWGKRNGPPYPLNRAGRIALRKQRKAEKAEIAAQKAKEKQEKKEAEFQEKKHKVLMGGSAAEVMKWQGQWTNEELKKIVDRLDYEAKISSKIPHVKTTQEKLKEATDVIGNVSNFGNKGADLWNTMARFYNASGSGKKNPMPYIPKAGQDYSNKNDKKDSNQTHSYEEQKPVKKKKKSTTRKYQNSFDSYEWDYD